MGETKTDINFIKDTLAKQGVTPIRLDKESGMSFSITDVYVCSYKLPHHSAILKAAGLL